MALFEHYLFIAVANYFTAALCLVLAFLLLRTRIWTLKNVLPAIFNIGIACWSAVFATMVISNDYKISYICAHLASVFTSLFNAALTHFVLLFLGKNIRQRLFIRINYALAIVVAILAAIPGFLVSSVSTKAGIPYYSDASIFYVVVPAQLAFNVLYSSWLIISNLKNYHGFKRKQLILFLLAYCIGYIGGSQAYLLVFGVPVAPSTTPLVAVFPILFTYAVMKHRFLDIQKLVKNTVLFSLLFVSLICTVSAVLYFLKQKVSASVGLSDAASQAIAIAIAISIYGPLKTGFTKLTQRFFYQDTRDAKHLFSNLSEDILHMLDPVDLSKAVTDRIAEVLSLETMMFFMRDSKTPSLFTRTAAVGSPLRRNIHQSKPLLLWLEKSRAYLTTPHSKTEARFLRREAGIKPIANDAELKRRAEIELAAIDGVAAFPVFVNAGLSAVMIVGQKKSDQAWNDEEMKVIASFCNHLALALKNSEYARGIQRTRAQLNASERDASAGALIAGIDHEVKNPLHTMSLSLGSLQSLLKNKRFLDSTFDKKSRAITMTMQSVLEDVKLVNEIIEHLSNLAHKKPVILEKDIRIEKIVDKVLLELSSQMDLEETQIQLELEKGLALESDPNILYEILANLIRNAWQATGLSGTVRILGKSTPSGVEILIQDNGCGIPEANLEKVFKPFFSTKKHNHNPDASGTGMGLFIVKEYMQALGGIIQVTSEEGSGTTFTLVFPYLPELEEAA